MEEAQLPLPDQDPQPQPQPQPPPQPQPDYPARQFELGATSELRRLLQQYTRSLPILDGSDKIALREWISHIDRVTGWIEIPNTVLIQHVGCLCTGVLNDFILSYLGTLQDGQKTWVNIRAGINNRFLGEDERAYQRSMLEQIIQAPLEDAKTYGERFKTQMLRAYTAQELGVPVVMESLVKLFLYNLHSDAIRTQVYMLS